MRWMIPLAIFTGAIVQGFPPIFALVLTAVGYLIDCKLYPYTRCRSCGGAKRHLSPSGADAWRHCTVCGGSGERDRLGRKILHVIGK